MMKWENFLAYQRRRVILKTLPREERENHPVRLWRKKYKLTQKQMGTLLGVSATCVGYWERGISITPDWVMDLVERPADDYILSKMEVLK